MKKKLILWAIIIAVVAGYAGRILKSLYDKVCR